MRSSQTLAAAAALAVLSACGNQADQGASPLKAVASAVIKPLRASKSVPAATQDDLAASISSALSATDNPLSVVVVENRDGYAIVSQIGENEGHRTWASADKRTITTKQGVITSTRGLGFDLMSSDLSESLTKISTIQTGIVEREMRYLGGENQTVVVRFSCSLARGGTQQIKIGAIDSKVTALVESCSNAGGLSFENTYQVSPDGEVLQSRQWVGPENGHLFVQVLRLG